ncbi:trehalose-phosphatase [Magnetospirillum fulvum]|uniref:Trehalose 6-phosphate phosphatase n=1 Tax=Magnetospirillum fulvum MGU-K5 TaxID=1316936 RepID=S9TF67_MAGFU|nr:trehalose-phosphatase [Magnetospirillum fulvum]EPY00906.1 trehalose-phosphatase [Magnetospirillum fulvum MGU-K5]
MVKIDAIDIGTRRLDWAEWALFLDIDGTLLDLAPTPDVVVVPAGLPQRLQSLSDRLSGAVALISGRSLESIDDLFPGGCDAAGTHGAEWRRSGRVEIVGEQWPAELTWWVKGESRHLSGLLLEEKPCSLAFHFAANPTIESAVRTLALTAAALSPIPLKLVGGKNVFELVPAGIDKGQAIERFLGIPPYAGRIPVFIGDDLTDEDGFRTINRLGGLSAHVGSRDTSARYRLGSPEEVRQWLTRLDILIGAPS